MVEILEVYIYSDQPATCPKCGSRTDFTEELLEDNEQTQYHKCLSENCSFEFIMENE